MKKNYDRPKSQTRVLKNSYFRETFLQPFPNNASYFTLIEHHLFSQFSFRLTPLHLPFFHTLTRTSTHKSTHLHLHTLKHTPINSHMHRSTHTHTLNHSWKHTHIHKQLYTHILTYMEASAHTHTYAHAQMHTHKNPRQKKIVMSKVFSPRAPLPTHCRQL